MKQGLILFAHGSRDPQWARPFKRIAASLSKKKTLLVKVAYLELMKPSLHEAIAFMTARGVRSIRIVPAFLGAGGHVKRDLPRLVTAANPTVRIRIDRPIGEQPAVVKAIAAAIAKRGGRASP